MRSLLVLSALTLGSFFTGNLFASECQQTVDSNKVILFINTNAAFGEIAAARDAACERGARLVTVPSHSTEELYHNENDRQDIEKDCKENGCTAAEKEERLQEVYQKYFKYKKEVTNPVNKENVLAEVKKLREQGAQVDSVTISGHNGGGTFGGITGEISKGEIRDIFHSTGMEGDVKSLNLLGCYTTTNQELFDWQSYFPNLAMIGGYHGQAPLARRKAGHDFIKDLLTAQDELTEAKEIEQIEEIIKGSEEAQDGIAGLNSMYSSLAILCGDETAGDHRGIVIRGPYGQRGFNNLDTQNCYGVEEEATVAYENFLTYYEGHEPIPLKTGPGSPIRVIYEFSHEYAHCKEQFGDEWLDPAQVQMLLFYRSAKYNFGRYFDLALAKKFPDPLDKVNSFEADNDPVFDGHMQGILGVMSKLRTKNDILNYREQLLNYHDQVWHPMYKELVGDMVNVLSDALNSRRLKKVKEAVPGLAKKAADVKAGKKKERLKQLAAEVPPMELPTAQKLDSMSRAEVREYIHKLHEDSPENRIYQEIYGKDFFELRDKMELTLNKLKCVPFQWHERNDRPQPPLEGCD